MPECRKCGAQVCWRHENGRWFCENADGSDHWDTCSKRRWQAVVRDGVHFERGGDKGYLHEDKAKFYSKSSGFVRGARYQMSGLCRECVPPWESCLACPDQNIQTMRRERWAKW